MCIIGHQKNGMSDELYTDGPDPDCCKTTSPARIKEHVKSCYEQRPNTFRNCKIHSYIFITVSNQTYCVDPDASWLPSRLEKLAAKGITCKIL
uniref:Chemokine interleukin-8-like domain-containing protein n=1 Tax=Fundulus heteroclitus TaxID=8078 RepID=A0A3Q2PRC6_FUNHE